MAMSEDHLAQAEHHIVETEGRITRQLAIMELLAEIGADITQAEQLLRAFQQSLVLTNHHRAMILEKLQDRRHRRPGPGEGRLHTRAGGGESIVSEKREPGHYWITLDEDAEPEVAHWDGGRWFAIGCEQPVEPLWVVSRPLESPATEPPKPA
jgi:hypothetical protein